MSGFATTPAPRANRWILIAASIFALLGSLAVATPSRAGDYYGPTGYEYGPHYGYYNPYRYHRDCYSCGCERCGCGRCYQGYRRGGSVVERRYYERKFVERSYVERRYVRPYHRYYPHYGYGYPRYGYPRYGYGYRSYEPGYRSYSRSFPWGYGGIRSEGYGPAGYDEEPAPRPPAPVGYGPYYDGRYGEVD
jgi:hypothetical protein